MATDRARRLRRISLAVIAASAALALWGRRAREAVVLREARLERALERHLLPGLDAGQSALSMAEFDFVRELDKRPELVGVIYFNKYAEVRWARDSSLYTMALPKLSESVAIPRAVIDAHAALVPVAEPGGGKVADAIAVPLIARGAVQGLVLLRGPADRRQDLIEWLESRRVSPPLPWLPSGEGARSALQHYLSGVILYQRGEAARAAEEWRYALLLSPGFADAREGLARATAAAPASRDATTAPRSAGAPR